MLLLDIEGTTTPVDFVFKTLFPYASLRLPSFLRAHADDPEIASLMRDLQKLSVSADAAANRSRAWRDDSPEASLQSAVAYAQSLMARDSKCTPLKALQGRIWCEGYESGELRGEVYPDVPRAFDRWRKLGKEICIYSSGSVLAQQLLFRTVSSGDLATKITGFFDTAVGSKTSADSYARIAAFVARTPSQFLFISDATKEIDAAHGAGMEAILCERDPQPSASPAMSVTIRSFDDVFPDQQSR